MTPHVIEYGSAGKYIYELSTGRGFAKDSRLFGVTVYLSEKLSGPYHEKSKCFHSKDEAFDYINTLREEV
jgi:hypothetical protein